MKEKINTITDNGYKPTELGPLPQEWQVVRLGEVAEKMKAGGTPRTNVNEYWNGKIPLVKVEDVVNSYKYLTSTNLYISDIGLKNSSAWIVPQGSIILTMYGTAGEVCINKIPVAVTQNVMVIISKNKTLTTEFLYYALKFAKNYTLHLISDKTIFTHFTLSKAKNLLIPLPPLEEQKKIAAILSTLQKAIEIESKLIERTKELKKSTMHKLFTEGTKGEKQKMTEIGPIPESWEMVRLGDVAEQIKVNYQPSLKGSKNYVGLEHIDSGLPFLNKCGKEFEVKSTKYFFKKGQVLYGKLRPYLDKAVITSFDGICSTDMSFCQ